MIENGNNKDGLNLSENDENCVRTLGKHVNEQIPRNVSARKRFVMIKEPINLFYAVLQIEVYISDPALSLD